MATEKENAAKVDLGLLEEDDEFEEFPADGKSHHVSFLSIGFCAILKGFCEVNTTPLLTIYNPVVCDASKHNAHKVLLMTKLFPRC